MTDIAFLPAKRLAALVRSKKIGCAELLEHFLARVARHNPKLNAIIATRVPAARKAAWAADAALRKRGAKLGPSSERRAADRASRRACAALRLLPVRLCAPPEHAWR